MAECKFTKWDKIKDPPGLRCETTVKFGQCPYTKVNGSNHCIMHGGQRALELRDKASIRNYRLVNWQKRVGEMTESSSIKSLREEVGILRVVE